MGAALLCCVSLLPLFAVPKVHNGTKVSSSLANPHRPHAGTAVDQANPISVAAQSQRTVLSPPPPSAAQQTAHVVHQPHQSRHQHQHTASTGQVKHPSPTVVSSGSAVDKPIHHMFPDPAITASLVLLGVTVAPLLVAYAIRAIPQPTLFAGLIVISFFLLNSGLSLLNRWALSQHGLSFPLTMTAMHMIFGSFALSPLMLLHPEYLARHEPLLRHEWRAIVAIGVLNGLQISANNGSLTAIELSLNQVVRGFGPVCVASLALCIEGKRITRAELLTLIAITVRNASNCAAACRSHPGSLYD